MQEMQQALSILPVDALRQLIVDAAHGKEAPVAFRQMPFMHAALMDELNAGRLKSNRPIIQYDHLQPTFLGTFVDVSELR
eukprot:7635448-Prorocentrum_lima.AAC.1